MSETWRFLINNRWYPIQVDVKGARLELRFRYNPSVLEEVKAMQGARWHPEDKFWSVANSLRNRFQLEWLRGGNPYADYDAPIQEFTTNRPLFAHQRTMVQHGLTYHYVIFACEMGTGKSLAAIEIMENSNLNKNEIWYVGPKAGVMAVERELVKWRSKIFPLMYTYEEFTKVMTKWADGTPPPKMVIFDESSKIKNASAKRTQAALKIGEAIRLEHGKAGYVILMSGTPAPKSPVDWHSQTECACPGFLREGDASKFKRNLCLIKDEQSITGGTFPKIVTWWDDENKCQQCGMFEKDHDAVFGDHKFIPSKNEVARLYKKMKGLALVMFKKDCLDLPDKIYEEIKIQPTIEILRSARLLTSIGGQGAQVLTSLRELSDGFQYKDVPDGQEDCIVCEATGRRKTKVPKANMNDELEIPNPNTMALGEFEEMEVICDKCGGSGKVTRYKRITEAVGTPKDEYFLNDLDELEEIGRYIVWGGFTGTIDRLTEMARKAGWYVLQVDGRGYKGFNPEGCQTPFDGDIVKDLLDAMDGSNPRRKELEEMFPRVCFVGHPRAGGMALTLTASPIELFFSNDFSGEARMQAEDRFHRAGMDANRGARIKDLIMLPSDKLVLENLRKKKDLQSLSLGEVKAAMEGL